MKGCIPRENLVPGIMVQEAGCAAELLFEVAGEMRQLLIAEIQGDAFNRFTRFEFLVSSFETVCAQPLAKCAAVGTPEMPLDGTS